jgi:hypothetical protein
LNDDNAEAIAAAEAIPLLVPSLMYWRARGAVHGVEGVVAAKAAGVLCNLALKNAGRVDIAAADAIRPLVWLLGDGTEEGKANTAGALWYLASDDDNIETIAVFGAIPPLVTLLREGTAVGKERAAEALLKLSSIEKYRPKIESTGRYVVAAMAEGSGELAQTCRDILSRL